MVKILLGLEEVNPHKPNVAGETPLTYAVRFGHKVIALLQPYEVLTSSAT